jgi:hypothetical protein
MALEKLAHRAELVYVARDFHQNMRRQDVVLPKTEFQSGGKDIEAFTLDDLSNGSFEVMFIDKATQKNLASYTVQNQKFKEKGASYDITKFFEFAVSEFKIVNG